MVPSNIKNICYSLLEEYGGWEINEWSQGNIVFTKDEISVNHEWNTEEDDSNEIDIEITEVIISMKINRKTIAPPFQRF
jgi:hypothetical protein